MRVEIIEKTIYEYHELSDKSKEKARDWYRGDGEDFEFDVEWVYEDASTVAKLMGIDLEKTRVTLIGGGHRYKPTIFLQRVLEPGGWGLL